MHPHLFLSPTLSCFSRSFRKNEKVQKILSAQDDVKSVHVQGRAVREEDGAFLANQRAIQFEKEAVATEKHNLWWVNRMLDKMGTGQCVHTLFMRPNVNTFTCKPRFLSARNLSGWAWLVDSENRTRVCVCVCVCVCV